MATKLWAMEENDLATADELEVSPEEGEAAATQAEMETEIDDVQESADQIDSGVEAAGELEQVEELVSDAAEQGEGLTPVAAEAIRLTVSAIARKVGANPKSVYRLYASENFRTASARKGNSVHALEGVQEFLKDLWKKIKAALTKLWAKVKAMWDKHISTTGRMVKALESMKSKVRSSSGKINGKPYLDKLPSSLASLYKGTGDLSIQEVQSYVITETTVTERYKAAETLIGELDKIIASADKDVIKSAQALNNALDSFKFNAIQQAVIGGEILTIKLDDDAEEGLATILIEREAVDNVDEERGMAVADKSSLVALIDFTVKSVKAIHKFKTDSDKLDQKQNEALNKVEKLIDAGLSKANENKAKAEFNFNSDGAPVVRKLMRIIYKSATSKAKTDAVMIREALRAAKATLTYTAVCLKQYK